MVKAFLSHSSSDKGFVRLVADRLGRARIVYDEKTFAPGEDFRKAILDGLDSTRLFVFFASKASLQSSWCQFEIDEAQLRQIRQSLDGQLVVVIDPSITLSDLPAWMRRCKVIFQSRPTQVVREVQNMLFALTPSETRRPFVGRHKEIADFSKALSELESAPRLISVAGLEGIGRRTVIARVCSDLLGLRLGPMFFWDETKRLEDLYLWLYVETADSWDRTSLAEEIKRFNELETEPQLEEVVARLSILCQDRNVPCLIDTGGMLEESAQYSSVIGTVLCRLLEQHDDNYVACVHTRFPGVANLDCASLVFRTHIQPLSPSDTKLLLQQLLRQEGVPATNDAIEEISEYLDGYAPSAYFSTHYAKHYGLENLRGDKSALVDFKAKRFSAFINQLSLSSKQWEALRYLASEEALPLEAIGVVLDMSIDDAAKVLRGLIDLSVVVPVDGKFSIAKPIKDAIHRSKGFLDPKYYGEVRERLTKAFWLDDRRAPDVQVIDATMNAVSRSGVRDFDPYQDLVQASTVHRVALESYHRRDYAAALEYAQRAERMDPDRDDVRVIAFKALVQLEKWTEAKAKLAKIEERKDKHYFYLKGFMLRKQRRPAEAVEAFQSALNVGDRSLPVYRDMGECLFRLGRYNQAAEMVRQALNRQSDNIYILDLVVRVLTEGGDYKSAEEYLKQLARFDVDRKFVHHRQSKLYAAKGMWDLALAEAQTACAVGHAPFESFAQIPHVLIELKKFDEAEKAIDELEKRFKGVRKDVQIGLRCKLSIRRGDWREASVLWEQLRDKSSPVHEALLLRILDLKAGDKGLSLADRDAASRQAQELRKKGLPKDTMVDEEIEAE